MKKLLMAFPIMIILAASCNAQPAANQTPVAPNTTHTPPGLTPTPTPSSTATPTPTPAPANSGLLTTVSVSGSTNTLPYAIKIFNDGSASVLVQSEPEQDFKAGTVNAKILLAMLQNIGDVSQINGYCAKPASFSTITTVTYDGKTSGDISCSFTGNAGDLYNFINQTAQQLKISAIRVQHPF